MKINYKGNYSQVKLAVEDANEVLYSTEIYDLIRQRDSFNCSKKSPKEIAEILQKTDLEVEVKAYKPRWWFSKVLGYFDKRKPKSIFLNRRKLYRDTSSITNTIIHEYIHAVDHHFNNSIIEFGHNCGTFKNTAPYVIGNLAETIIDGHEISNIDASLKRLEDSNMMHCLNTSASNRSSLSQKEEFIIEENRIY